MPKLVNAVLLVLEVTLGAAVFIGLVVAIALTIFFGVAWGLSGG